MKVLFLCNKSPYPPREGGPMAMNANIRCLVNAGHQVKVVAMNTNKYFVNETDIPKAYKQDTGIELVYNDLSIKPLEAFINLFSSSSFHVDRFKSRDFENKIIEILQSETYDIVQLEMLYMTPYIDTIRKYSDARIVLRSHNIEHLIWERVVANTSNPLKRIYLETLTRILKNYELFHLNSYDGIITISQNDADFFKLNGCRIPIEEVPFGLDTGEYNVVDNNFEFPSLFHIGSMNWMPTNEGIQWFIDNAWPGIHSKFPDLKLYLAGREMPEWLTNLNTKNIEILGEVPDAKEFIQSKAVMIVPLFSGSGIRIKIIEGMALGKTIISTEIGAEGINYTNDENILIANTTDAFLAAVEKCVMDRTFCETIGTNANKLIHKDHSLNVVTKKLEGFYNKIL